MTCAPFEHFECRALFSKPFICTYYGGGNWNLQDFDFLEPAPSKEIDVYFSGMANSPLLANKVRMLFRLATINEKLNVQIVDGHMPLDDYKRTVQSSKYVFHGLRFWEGYGGRIVDTISKGSFFMIPDCAAYSGVVDVENTGLFEVSRENFETDIDRLVRDYQSNFDKLQRLEIDNREEWRQLCPSRRESETRFLKFCYFTWLIEKRFPRPKPAYNQSELHRPARHSTTYNVPRLHFDNDLLFQVQFAIDAANRNLQQPNPSVADYNAAAMLMVAQYFRQGVDECLKVAQQMLDTGLSHHPNSLVLLFNQSRLHFHHGDRLVAQQLLEWAIQHEDELELAPVEDDPLNISEHELLDHFPYGEYLNSIVDSVVKDAYVPFTDVRSGASPVDVMMSGAYSYLARIRADAGEKDLSLKLAKSGLDRFEGNFMLQKQACEVVPRQRL